MAKQNKTGLYTCIAVVVIVVIAIVIGVVIAKNNNKSGGGTGDAGGQTSGGASQNIPQYNTVDETIAYGDYDGMSVLAKQIQNGEKVGKVVKIDGLVSHPMSTYSVVEPNEDGSQKIGTQFIIEGAEDADYPEDGARIVITGEVFEKEPMYFVIKTTPEYIETIEVAE